VTGNQPSWDTSWARRAPARAVRVLLLDGILRPLISIYTHPKVFNAAQIRALPPPFVLAANHASHLDTPTIMTALPFSHRMRTSVVAAADYFFQHRATATFVSLAFATVPVERRGMSPETARRIDALISERWNVLMFPEGTRSRTGELGRLRPGAAFLARNHGIPIVPVYIWGTFDAMPVNARWAKRHPVTVDFGEPLFPGPTETPSALTERLQAALQQLAAQAAKRRDELG
jgi:1-acyl-sn-glycerol-3-phosphate acyltransferase